MSAIESVSEWHAFYGCDHAHCPNDCAKPEPFIQGDELWCGRCWFVRRKKSLMVPCDPTYKPVEQNAAPARVALS